MRWSLITKGEDECRNCGDRAVNLHHAIPKSICSEGRQELDNGLPLCALCHYGWHDGQVTIQRAVFTDREWSWIASRAAEQWLALHYPEHTTPGPF